MRVVVALGLFAVSAGCAPPSAGTAGAPSTTPSRSHAAQYAPVAKDGPAWSSESRALAATVPEPGAALPCRGDTAAACREAGLAATDSHEAQAAWLDACRARDAQACALLMRETAPERALSDAFAAHACTYGDKNACRFLTYSLADATVGHAGNPAEARRLRAWAVVRGCSVGDLDQCVEVITGGVEADAAHARAKLVAVCREDTYPAHRACGALAQLSTGVQAVEYATRACALLLSPIEKKEFRQRVMTSETCAAARAAGVDLERLPVISVTGTAGHTPPSIVPQSELRGTQVFGQTQIYPSERDKAALAARGIGKTILAVKLCFDVRGRIESLWIIRPSPMPGWDAKVFTAMRAWRYRPFVVDGVPTPVCTASSFIYQQR